MNTTEAIDILTKHNEWRRGGAYPMLTPTDIGICIDNVIRILKTQLDNEIKMKKYTLKTIKETVCYKSNINTIKSIYPDHWHLFAKELMIVANENSGHWVDDKNIAAICCWDLTPQGYWAWDNIYTEIEIFRKKKSRRNKETE